MSKGLSELDTLKIEVLKSDLFISSSSGKKFPISNKSEKYIPLQMPSNQETLLEAMEKAAKILEVGTNSLFGTNLAAKLLLQGSMAVMWGMINTN